MPNPVYVQRFGYIKTEIARALGPGVFVGAATATSGTATTLVDTVNFTDTTDTRLKGVNVYIHNGAGQSRETRGTAFTPATDTITIPSGTALDSTSEYILTRGVTQSDILAAMRLVLQHKGLYAKSYDDQSLLGGSPLVNATFYDNSGTFPNGWTRTGTGGAFTRESTVSKHGRYSCSIVSDGTNAAGIRQDVTNVGLYRGKSVRAKAWLFTNTASNRVEFLIDDGIDTTTGLLRLNTTNRGWGTAIAETPSLTVSDRATRLRVSVNITAGSAVTVYVSGVYINGGPHWREWDLPAGSPTAIEYIEVEDTPEGHFRDNTLYPHTCFEAVEEATVRLRLKVHVPLAHIMHIKGRTSWVDHTSASADDDTNWDSDPSGLITASAAVLLAKTPAEKLAVLDTHWFTKRAIQAPNGALVLRRQ